MMEEFRVRMFDDPATKSFLEGAVRLSICVPFLGAGFTGGEPARSKPVPFGSQWRQTMCDQILASASTDKPTEAELKGMSFQEVADIYFSSPFVHLDEIKRTLDAHFSRVTIRSGVKRRFLELEWPYLYTLNIDDGIERAIDAIRILPYRSFGKIPNKRFVYKLHGDVEDLLAAPNHEAMAAVFGRKQYIGSLEKNEQMLADLANDFAEKNLLFAGCSLTDELDILFSLARAESVNAHGKGARIYVCSAAPTTFTEKKKMRDYGVTDVVVVSDHAALYSFLAEAVERTDDTESPITSYEYVDKKRAPKSKLRQVRYLIQAGWRDDPYDLSIRRQVERSVHAAITQHSLVAVWGRRFSGRTTLLYRLLNEHKTRKRYFLSSSTTVSDSLFNAILRAKNSLIAIDSNALFSDQLRRLAQQHHRIGENGSTVVVCMARADLNSFGRDFDYENCVFNLEQSFRGKECDAIDEVISPLGYQKWTRKDTILDNVFTIAASPITATTLKDASVLETKLRQLSDGWKKGESTKLQLMIVYYLAVRHRIPSKYVRALAKARGQGYMGEVLLDELPASWQPFVEREPSDPSSRVAGNSETQLVSNSFAWLSRAVRIVSEKVGPEGSAEMISALFSAIYKVDPSAFELVLFDNLNSIYESSTSGADWRGKVIRSVYEKLSGSLSSRPDYWLQRAKSIYYISSDPDELREAAAYCEKGIVERAAKKTWSNAQLTRANIYGKLCLLTDYSRDEDMLTALHAYQTAIDQSELNASYIDELVRKSKNGKHYLSRLCAAASKKAGMLHARSVVRELQAYLSQS